jgi:transposase InsO family protein
MGICSYARAESKPVLRNILVCIFAYLYEKQPQRGIIFHSDRGSQYTRRACTVTPLRKGFVASMSGKGNCYDNAHAESFFHTMKVEELYGNSLATRHDVNLSIFEYIEVFYNRFRKHS